MNPLFSWRVKILESTDLSPSAKYFLLALSTYMNEWGDGAFPSIGRIAGQLGHSERTVYRMMEEAVSKKWLIKQNRYNDGRQLTNNYIATMPDENRGGTEVLTPVSGVGVTPVSGGGCHGCQEGDDAHVIQNSSINSSKNIYAHRDDEREFDEFWKAYPRKVAKKEAQKAWRGLTKGKRKKALAHLASNPYRYLEKHFIPYPSSYLRGERFEDEHDSATTRNSIFAGAI